MPRPHERLRVFCSHLKPRQCPAGAVSTLRQALSADEEAEALGLLCTPLSPVFGVRVHGLDGARPASAATASCVRALLARHKLLLIASGRLSVAQLASLGRSLELGEGEEFGASDLADYFSVPVPEENNVMQIEYGPEVAPADINIWQCASPPCPPSSRDPSGSPAWFLDSQDHSWHESPTRFELSYADLVPPSGGDVIFADAAAAHDSLSPPMRDMLTGKTCVTVLANGYQNLDIQQPEFAQALADRPPIQQPVIAVDPESGVRTLNVNAAYSHRIVELSKAESEAVLPMLCAHVTAPEHCVRISYEQGDICLFVSTRPSPPPANSPA